MTTQSQSIPCGRCPAWCDRDHPPDDPYTHHGAAQRWTNGDTEGNDLRVWVSLYRGDDPLYPQLPTAIGDTAIDLYISGDDSMIDVDDEGRPELFGYLMPDDLRNLARWLLGVAEQADPHHTNGKPVELAKQRAAAPSWVLSPIDWRAHAVDIDADHPVGVWIARCGAHLSTAAPLCPQPPGHQCPVCERWATR